MVNHSLTLPRLGRYGWVLLWTAVSVCAVPVVADEALRPASSDSSDAQPSPQPDAAFGDDLTLGQADNDFAEMDLEALMQVQVTSVAGQATDWFTTPAAVTVITADDIRRTGHQFIAEALRLAPGLHVARVSSHEWTVSSRGVDFSRSSKLQVNVDGRIAYGPLFSGVFWDEHEMIMADIEQIEVVRGPGATLWGANAVNGVINITSKSAKDTQGLYATGGVGNELLGMTALRYGGQLNDDTWFRVWGKHYEHDESVYQTGGDANDDFGSTYAGVRLDGDAADHLSWAFIANMAHSNSMGRQVSMPSPTGHFARTTFVNELTFTNYNLLGRLRRDDPSGAWWQVEAYYDRRQRNDATRAAFTRETWNLDLRHFLPIGQRNELHWGLAYQFTQDRVNNIPQILFNPSTRTIQTFSGFVQDTFELIDEQLFLMIGSKFEHNDFTGFEIQPSGRIWWTPNDEHMLWAAVSRPVRTASRTEQDLTFVQNYADSGLLGGGPPSGVFVPLAATGNREVESENVTSYELGYRTRVIPDLTIDIAGFHSDYRELLTADPALGGLFANSRVAKSNGVEITLQYVPAENWRIDATYSFLNVDVMGTNTLETNSPRNIAHIRSTYEIGQDWELNAAVYYVDNVGRASIPAYVRADAGVTWRPAPEWEASVWVQGLFDNGRRENQDMEFSTVANEFERAVFVQLTHRF